MIGLIDLSPSRFVVSSIVSVGLIVLVLLAKKVFKNHISAKWQYNICFLFIAVLVMPFIPNIFYGLEGITNLMGWGGKAYKTLTDSLSEANPVSIQFSGTEWMQDFALSVSKTTPVYLSLALVVAWLIGSVIYTAVTIACNLDIRRIKQTARFVENEKINNIFKQCKAELKISKNILLCESDRIQTPMAVGLIKTYIFLPSAVIEKLSAKDLRNIILHELFHFKNRDIAVNYIMCFLQIVYWFNPFVHLAFKQMRIDREIACDASVLKTLDETGCINYGETIINFAEMPGRSARLNIATDMGGSGTQIKRRIEKIASFTEDTLRLKIKSVVIFLLAVLLVLSQAPAISAISFEHARFGFSDENVVYEDLSAYFSGFEGSFVLYDLKTDMYSIYNKEKSVTRVAPNSTYKIFSALIALEENIITKENSTLIWDGTDYPFETWNRNQDLTTAMRDSVSWYFQEIDKRTGLENLQGYLKDIAYGNYDISGGVENYMLDTTLRISPVEQVLILKDFYENKHSFNRENINTVKDIIKISEKDGSVLSGKTGTGMVDGFGVNAWFIGYIEKEGNLYMFAVNIQGKDGASGSVAAGIALSILNDKGIY